MVVTEHRYKLRGGRVRDNICALLHELPDAPTYEVIIRPWKSKRSLEQNDHMWRLIRAIAQGDGVEQTKDRLLMKWSGYEVKTLPDGSQYPVPRVGSSRLTVPEMSEFIGWLQAFAAEWGIEVAE